MTVDPRVAKRLRVAVSEFAQRHGSPSTPTSTGKSPPSGETGAALALNLNPRNVARLFYDAGGDGTFFTQRS